MKLFLIVLSALVLLTSPVAASSNPPTVDMPSPGRCNCATLHTTTDHHAPLLLLFVAAAWLLVQRRRS